MIFRLTLFRLNFNYFFAKFDCSRMLKFITFFLITLNASAGDVLVAVAANFTAPMQRIAQEYQLDSGHQVSLSFGSTGSFYTQIKNGAPYEILLSADDETPLKLERDGLAVIGTRFTYATGRLVLWSKQLGLVDANGEILRSNKFQKIAIANPKLAPYGAAAIEVMTKMGVIKDLTSKLVQGESIGQTYQFVATENARIGFVALSQISFNGQITQGSAWVVPKNYYNAIQQDAILITKGRNNPAAISLLNYMKSDKIKTIIKSYGYDF